MNYKIKAIVALGLSGFFLSGCAATQVALSKKDLDVQNKMSATLFLDPVEDTNLKSIYIQSKNSSDYQDLEMSHSLKNALNAKGFKIVSRMNDAHYVLQINVLQVGKMDPSAAEAAIYRGYGTDGVMLGAATAYVAGGSSVAIVGAGILGGVISVVADSLVKDVHYGIITDIQIRERVYGKKSVDNSNISYNQMGTNGVSISSHSEKSQWKTYQTRVLSSANKVNLKFEEALPQLQASLTRVISGVF